MMKNRCTDTDSIASCLAAAGVSRDLLDRLSREAGFTIRSGGKINGFELACALLCESVQGQPSFNDLAVRMEDDEEIRVSRQAIGKRFGAPFYRLMKSILEHALDFRSAVVEPWAGLFSRILIQDSTVIRLPVRLFEEYSGVSNGHAPVCNARVQVVYDVLAGQFVSFSIDPYSKNDLSVASELEIRSGDMVLRDRGYLTANEIQRHLDIGAECVYRHKHLTTYIDPKTGEPVELLAMLEKYGSLDLDVCLNNAEKTPVRLVAAAVDEETANNRRRKLKKEAHGHKPSADNLKMMSWTVLLTTLSREEASFKKLLRLYSLRWRIETTFKAWKSNMSFADIHNVSAIQLRCILIARLTMAVLLNNFIFKPACLNVRANYEKNLSLMKLTKHMAGRLGKWKEIIQALARPGSRDACLYSLSRHCSYDKRKRRNFQDEITSIKKEWALG